MDMWPSKPARRYAGLKGELRTLQYCSAPLKAATRPPMLSQWCFSSYSRHEMKTNCTVYESEGKNIDGLAHENHDRCGVFAVFEGCKMWYADCPFGKDTRHSPVFARSPMQQRFLDFDLPQGCVWIVLWCRNSLQVNEVGRRCYGGKRFLLSEKKVARVKELLEASK